MELKQFKKDIKLLGVTYKEVKDAFEPDDHCPTLEGLISDECAAEIILESLILGGKPESDVWMLKAKQLVLFQEFTQLAADEGFKPLEGFKTIATALGYEVQG